MPGMTMTEKILAVLFVFIKSLIAATGYAGITILMAVESACIPLPSELIMPFAGYLAFEGTMKLVWVATAGAIGGGPSITFPWLSPSSPPPSAGPSAGTVSGTRG